MSGTSSSVPTMDMHPRMARAAQALIDIASAVKPDQLTAPTPCGDWDVRDLVNHLILWSGIRAARAARKEAPPADDPTNDSTDFTGDGGWADLLAKEISAAVAAWERPRAWEGDTGLAGGSLPASTIAGMIFGEYALHGWDLARATGQEFRCDDDVAAALLAYVEGMAEPGRQYGVFGDAVPVPDDASVLDRALALSGRDPAWAPA